MRRVTFDFDSGLSVIVYPETDCVVFVSPMDTARPRIPAMTIEETIEAIKKAKATL